MRKDALLLLGVLGLLALLLGGSAARASESNADSVQSAQRTQSQSLVRMMTLKEALSYAQQHQPSLLAARSRIVAAQRAARSIRAEWLPQLGVTAQGFYGTMNNSTAMFLGVRTVDLPRIGGSRSDGGFGDSYPSSVVALGLRQNVWDFGRLAALSLAADAEATVYVHRATQEGLQVALQVESLYYAVLAAKAVSRAAEDAYQRASLRREMVLAGVSRGLRATIDLTRAEADLTRFDVGRLRARGGIETAQALLAAAVGIPELLLDTTGSIEESAPLPLFGEALQQALTRDPGLLAALAKLSAQQALTRATTLQLAPTVSLTAGISGRAGGAPQNSGPSGQSGWLPTVPNWDIGLVLQAPIFDGVVLARRSQSQAVEEVLRQEVTLTRRRLLAEIQGAYITFHTAQSSLPALVVATDTALKNYEQASARFRAGLSTSIELADAEALRTEAEIQLAIGHMEVARARAAVGRTIAQGL